MGPQAEIVGTGTVFVHAGSNPYARDADWNFNHAPSVVLMPDNRLLTMWFSGPWEGHHLQALLASYSSDGGKTWSDGQVFRDTYGNADFDPAFIRDRESVWLFSTHAARYAVLAGQKTGRQGCWAQRTDDSGESWSDPVKVCPVEGPRSNGIVLDSGDLLVGVYADDAAGVLKSGDGGRNWRRSGHVVGEHGHEEPTIVELGEGRLLMFLRNGSGYIWRSRSDDGGGTWSEAEQTDIMANRSSHCLYRLRDGRRGYVNRCVNDIRRRPSQPLIQWRFHPHTVHRDRRLRSTQGPSDA